jgi:hypothetical protein
MECAWRILGNAITSKEPAVHCVPIHLPDRNIPKFRTTISDPINGASPLIRYFNRPLDLIFRHLTILDYYQEFVLYNHLKDPKPDTFYYELPITNAVPNIVVHKNTELRRADYKSFLPPLGKYSTSVRYCYTNRVDLSKKFLPLMISNVPTSMKLLYVWVYSITKMKVR